MKILYFDIIGGISGDMSAAALLDLGVDLDILKRKLKKIKVGGYSLDKSFVERGHVKAVKFDVVISKPGNYPYDKITSLMRQSSLAERVKKNILKVYEVLHSAETNVHGHKHKNITFQQLGDIDSIIDIASFCICIEELGVGKILYSAIPFNYGLAPATLELMQGKDIYFTGRNYENITPTGMAILSALGKQVDSSANRVFKIGRSGYGAGTFNPSDITNVLRVSEINVGDFENDEVAAMESNIDDMNPQVFEHVFDRLFDQGALDAYLSPIYMKKTRPGFLLTVLSNTENLGKMANIILSETTSTGVRFSVNHRIKLARDIKIFVSGKDKVRVKRIKMPDGSFNFAPEYEDCKILARQKKMPLLRVYEDIKRKVTESWHSLD